jgi:hypothetical protein
LDNARLGVHKRQKIHFKRIHKRQDTDYIIAGYIPITILQKAGYTLITIPQKAGYSFHIHSSKGRILI